MKNLFVILFFLYFQLESRAQTYVSGGIFTNTTWTLAGSPYIIPDTVVVFQNIILTIEPGVIVKLDSFSLLEVRGSLVSVGVLNDSILFTSLNPNTSRKYWFAVYINSTFGASGDFNRCIFQFGSSAIMINSGINGGHVTVRNSRFENNLDCIYGGMLQEASIDSCLFINNSRGVFSGNNNLSNSIFINNEQAVGLGSDVYNCTFCRNGIALWGANRDLQNSIITNNRIGINNGGAGFTNVSGNLVAENDTGIILTSNTVYSNGLGVNNIICNNHIYDLLCYSLFNVSIPNNCWCDIDSVAIRSKIYDGYNNTAYGLIDFMPVLNCDSSDLPDSTACGVLFAEIPSNELPIGQVELYPNPALDKLQIYSSEKILQIRIFDLPGKEMLTKRISAFENDLDIRSFSLGIYFIQLEMKNSIVLKKFIKD